MEDQSLSRRKFIEQTGKATVALGVSATVLPAVVSCNAPKVVMASGPFSTPYTQQPLPYDYKALDPVIDALTMEIHYSRHAAAYAKALAEATAAEGVNNATTTLETLLNNISKYSPKMRNNAGGHYNHELFWRCMAPKAMNKPQGSLLSALTRDFGSYETFTTQFEDAGKTRFGSGWHGWF